MRSRWIDSVSLGHKILWFVTGRYYGYPSCCINSFCGLKHLGKKNIQQEVAKGHGFIPCLKCAKRVASGEIRLEDLVRDRKSPMPFPVDTGDNANEHFDKWLEGVLNEA